MYSRDGDQYTQTTTLSPEQRALYDAETGNAINRAGYASDAGGRLSETLANRFSLNGLPSRVSSVDNSPYRTDINANSVAQRGVDLSGQPSLTQDFSGERQRVEDSLYGRATGRLDDQFSRREEDVRTQLMNQGIREGSEAWNNSMRDFGNERQDAYGDARDRAIMAGGSEQSRLFADALRARQQGVGEQFGLGEFANQAAQQEFGNEAARNTLYNAGAGAEFDQNLVNAGLTNSARDAGINEQMIPRNQAMDEYMSLYGYGGAPGNPGVPGVSGPQPGDYQGAANQLYGYQTDVYNANQARRSGNMQTGMQLATTLAMLSDRRAKHDICHVGHLPNGIPTYRYKYIGEDQTRLGVMADEVADLMPAAVTTGADGLLRVNYAMIGGQHLLEAN